MLLQPLPAIVIAVHCLWGDVAEPVLLLYTWQLILSPGIKLLQLLSVLLLLDIIGAASQLGRLASKSRDVAVATCAQRSSTTLTRIKTR